jgi:hypothetical protein
MHLHIVSHVLVFPIFLLISIVMPVINTCCALFYNHCVGGINLGTFGVAHKSHIFGLSGSSIALSRAMWDSCSASWLLLLSFRLSKLPFHSCQYLVSKKLTGALLLWYFAGSQLSHWIQRTFISSVCPPVTSFRDNADDTGDVSINVNAAALSVWKSEKDALMISSVSKINTKDVICLQSAWDSFRAVYRF